MAQLYLKFYQVLVVIDTDWKDVCSVLEKDFSAFMISTMAGVALFGSKHNLKKDKIFHLKILRERPTSGILPTMVASMQTSRSICYDQNELRFNDYYGELTSVLDTKKNEGTIYSEQFELAHEIAYLFILSRVGKMLDLEGLHKLHAFGVTFKNRAILFMMPSGGGKSTLLLELLKDSRFKMLSDDIPIVDRKGRVRTFPIKIGLPQGLKEEAQTLRALGVNSSGENLYTMNRKQYGPKRLLSLRAVHSKVETEFENIWDKVILIEGYRYNCHQSVLMEVRGIGLVKGILRHGVIGFGLPIVFEYFWEKGLADLFRKGFIFCSRLFAFTMLLFSSRKLKLYLGTDVSRAAQELIRFLEKNEDI